MAIFNSANNSLQSHNKTLFEAVMLADLYGNPIPGGNPTGMAVDAFGRQRVAQPFTLFESFHRYQENGGRISSANSATGSTQAHNANAGLIECTLNTTSGSFVHRESSRVFAYQPGKSLQILQTFVMAPGKENLRQRIGYFGTQNGFFLEQEGTNVYFVRRSYVTGSVVDTRVGQADWNFDKLDGTGPSNITLDISKAQILFTDIEWLGVGSVRMGFVINGQFIHCHTFNHANIITSSYMTTACLPVRMEIENTGTTSSSSTFKIICTTVISEGGYELKGRLNSHYLPITSPKDLPTAGVFTPLMSIRLKDSRYDGIVFPRSIEFFGVTNNTTYRWKIVAGGTLTGASWVSAGEDSSVEYDNSATAITGGVDFRSQYVNVSAGAGAALSEIQASDIFRYQLERNSFAANNKGVVYSLVATGASNGNDAVGGIQWEEIT